VELITLFLVTLTRNIKSQEIFRLNTLNHIIIKVDLYTAQTGLTVLQLVKLWDNSNPLDVCGAVVAICIGNVLKRQIQNLCRASAIEP
jgi:hypothetical protein